MKIKLGREIGLTEFFLKLAAALATIIGLPYLMFWVMLNL